MARKKKTTKKEKELDPRKQALELTIEHITKRCGQGSIMVLGKDYHSEVPAISTGSLRQNQRMDSRSRAASSNSRSDRSYMN